jgi:threonine/homoserine/homoserine lactone efflux protein
MNDVGGIFGSGVLLGMGAAVPVGPVNVEIARRALRGGFRAGFALGCGAVTIDVTYAILTSLFFRAMIDKPAIRLAIGIPGALLLGFLGVMSLRAALKHLHRDPLEVAPRAGSPHAAYVTGLLMTLLNPMTLGFWFVAVPARVASITEDPRRDLPMICAGVFIGTIGWVVIFSGLLAWAGRYRRNWWMAIADGIGGLVLLAFALGAAWRLIS